MQELHDELCHRLITGSPEFRLRKRGLFVISSAQRGKFLPKANPARTFRRNEEDKTDWFALLAHATRRIKAAPTFFGCADGSQARTPTLPAQ